MNAGSRTRLTLSLSFSFALVSLMPSTALLARTFTDDAGRQVDAELVGVRGENVVIARQGVAAQWPLAKLSPADQAYVREWQQGRSAVAKLSVRIFERDGIGEKGVFSAEKGKGSAGGLPGLPGAPALPLAPQTEQRSRYKHYDADITNPAAVDANQLKVDYVLYVIMPDGTVGTESGSQKLASLAAGQRATVKTEAITFTRTKTTSTTLSINANRLGGSVTTSQKTSRSTERFGGAWVRVRGVDGSLLGEARSLHPELERLNPPWVGAEESEVEEIPVLKALDGLLELLKNLPKPPGVSISTSDSSSTTTGNSANPPMPPVPALTPPGVGSGTSTPPALPTPPSPPKGGPRPPGPGFPPRP